MFTQTRLKLTAWYLIIIMTISILFSVAIYYLLDHEIQINYSRVSRRQQMFYDQEVFPDQSILIASENRLKENLVVLNLIILIISGAAGYFLAGRTLRPIRKMVDEQNRFVADASHELRTPLTALRTSIEVNLRDQNLTSNTAKAVLTENLEDVVSLQKLSDNLLVLSSSGSLRLKTVSLEKIIDAAAKNIPIKKTVTETKFLGDAEKLTRLVTILLDNAGKYSSQNSEIDILALPINHQIKIEVTDRGLGISPEDLPHIFDRFYRADKARTRANGHGLGLAIAKRIVTLHGGTITVVSEVGKGSTFTVLLPTHT